MNINLYKKKTNIHFILQIILFALLIFIDQLTKYIVVKNLKGHDPVPVIKDVVEFRYLENSGAAFGLLQNQMWLFYVLTIVVFCIIVFIWIKLTLGLKKYSFLSIEEPDNFLLKTFNNMEFLGYILMALGAGAIGNLIDRFANQYVVDFIYFKIIDFAIFNFADICVTVSVILLCIFFIFIYKEDKNFVLFKKKN